jgi:hypothetical protein
MLKYDKDRPSTFRERLLVFTIAAALLMAIIFAVTVAVTAEMKGVP